MLAPDGKRRKTQCANIEQLLRIIQSIPSPKAEPFKRWLAKVGYERLDEIENPELAAARMRELYKAKGYSDEWVEKRVRGIAVRDELTNEWQKRGVKQQREYAMPTAEISRATFGMFLTPGRYVGAEAIEDDGEPFEEKMARLMAELSGQFSKSAKREETIRKNLPGLGHAD